MSDIDTALVDRLKALDPKRPIREADIGRLFDDLIGQRQAHLVETESPSALAVLRLSTNSNLVGNMIGKSPGLSPLSTRPV